MLLVRLFLLLMPVFPQPLFPLVGGHFVSFPLFTTWHDAIFLIVKLIMTSR